MSERHKSKTSSLENEKPLTPWFKFMPYFVCLVFTIIIIMSIIYLCQYFFPATCTKSSLYSLGGTSALRAFSTNSVAYAK
jgi:hypothetical protein